MAKYEYVEDDTFLGSTVEVDNDLDKIAFELQSSAKDRYGDVSQIICNKSGDSLMFAIVLNSNNIDTRKRYKVSITELKEN